MAGNNAVQLIKEHGSVLEVHLKEGGRIDAVFSSGVQVTLGSGFQYGYMGTGPDLFGGWLTAAGFEVTEGAIAQMERGMVLKNPNPGSQREVKCPHCNRFEWCTVPGGEVVHCHSCGEKYVSPRSDCQQRDRTRLR
jgi:ribosomal protein S27E